MSKGRERLSPSAEDWPFGGLTGEMRRDPLLAALASARPTAEELENGRALLREVGGRMIALAVMEERGEFDLEEVAGRYYP